MTRAGVGGTRRLAHFLFTEVEGDIGGLDSKTNEKTYTREFDSCANTTSRDSRPRDPAGRARPTRDRSAVPGTYELDVPAADYLRSERSTPDAEALASIPDKGEGSGLFRLPAAWWAR